MMDKNKNRRKIDKITRKREDARKKRESGNQFNFNQNNASIYNTENKRIDRNKQRNQKMNLNNRSRKRVLKTKGKNKSFKNYYIFLILALIILLISILSGSKKEDVSKFFYLQNQIIKTKDIIQIKPAKNSTAKVAVLSIDDIREYFDKNIRYDDNKKEVITIGDSHIAKIMLNDFAININGTDSVINTSAYKEDKTVYLPLNDLSSVYGIEVFVSNTNRVIVDKIHSEKKIVTVLPNTKLKKSQTVFSKTLKKLSDSKIGSSEECVLVSEGKKYYKVRAVDGIYGYVAKSKVKNVLEIRSNYIESEKIPYHFINNYSNPDDNFDNVKKEGEYNASIIDVLNIKTKGNALVSESKYDVSASSYKIFRNKLKTNNIDTFIKSDTSKFDLSKYLETFEKRQKFVSESLKIANKHDVQGIELIVDTKSKLNIYEYLVEEMRPRLKERGLKLVIKKDNIKSDKIKENIDYEY